MEDRIERFTPEFRNISNRSVIRFIFRDMDEVIGYQLEMLKNNRIPALLPCEVLTVDGEVRLSYDITSMVTMKKLLERKEIDRDDFIRYMKQIIGVFNQLENHLLDYGGILLSGDCIYMSPSDDMLYFIYIPDRRMPESVNEPLRDFIMRLVIHEMKFKNENADDYIQKLIGALKTPDFGLPVLKSYLDGLAKGRGESIAPQPPAASSEEFFRPQAPPKIPARPTIPANPSFPGEKVRNEVRTETVKAYPVKSYIILAADLLCLAALFIILGASGKFRPDNPDMLVTLVGLLLVGGAATYLVYSKAFAPEKKVERTITRKTAIRPAQETGRRSEKAAKPTNPSNSYQYVNKAIRQPEYQNRPAEKVPMPVHTQSADRTVLLSEIGMNMPSLKRLGSDGETIVLNRWPFRIGRLPGQVDYCLMNPAVGKIHAEIIKKPEGYFITDMNTRNGTFVNGDRVEANSENPLKNGDKITLANEEFLFCE